MQLVYYQRALMTIGSFISHWPAFTFVFQLVIWPARTLGSTFPTRRPIKRGLGLGGGEETRFSARLGFYCLLFRHVSGPMNQALKQPRRSIMRAPYNV